MEYASASDRFPIQYQIHHFPNEFQNLQTFILFIRITNCRRLFPLWFECVKLSTVDAFRWMFQFGSILKGGCYFWLFALHLCCRRSIPSFFLYSGEGRKIIIIIIKSGGVMFIWAICHVPEYAFSIIMNAIHSNVENNRHVHDFLLFHLTELEKKHISKYTKQGRRYK